MSIAEKTETRSQIQQFLRDAGEEGMSWAEFHGLLCAAVCGPAAPADWHTLTTESPVGEDIAAAMHALATELASRAGLGEPFRLPCRLDPYEDRDGEDLASWCTGFMAGVFLQEETWYLADEEKMANWLLPFVLISGLDEDPELDALWEDERLVRQMAGGIPELLEELFLHFHAPELAD